MLTQTILQLTAAAPTRVAVVVGGKQYSYKFLLSHAQIAADYLMQHKIQRLGVVADRKIENYIAIAACMLIGAAYIPLNPKLPADRLEAIKAEAEIDAVFSELNIDYKNSQTVVLRAANYPASNNAYIMFTSGSTGVPKGVPVSYANLNSFITMMRQHHQLTSDDRVAQYSDLSFDLSVYDIFMAWTAGAALYVVPEAQRLAPAKFIQDNEISVWFSVASVISIMRRLNLLEKGSLPSIRLSMFSGEALLVKDAAAWQAATVNGVIDNLYGPTEATVEFLAHRFRPDHEDNISEHAITPIGQPLPGNIVAIVDENLNWVQDGAAGEFLLSGPQVVVGYWRNKALTDEKFITLEHPTYGRSRWYRTGDKVCKDAQGFYRYLGRIDNQVRMQGYRVELEEVEYYLRQVLATTAVAAVVITNAQNENTLLAVVEADAVDTQAVRQRLQEMLPFYMLPQRIIAIDKLPRNANGKLDRRALQELIN